MINITGNKQAMQALKSLILISLQNQDCHSKCFAKAHYYYSKKLHLQSHQFLSAINLCSKLLSKNVSQNKQYQEGDALSATATQMQNEKFLFQVFPDRTLKSLRRIKLLLLFLIYYKFIKIIQMNASTFCNQCNSSASSSQTCKKQHYSSQQLSYCARPDETFINNRENQNSIKNHPFEAQNEIKCDQFQSQMIKVSKTDFHPNSINHNFQKHTVITIKKLTKNIASCFGQTKIEILAHQMWNIFLTSGIKSKRILVILFGSANMQDIRYKQLLKNCFFGGLCNYQEETIRCAQNFLRQKAIELLTKQRVRRNIQKRKSIKLREQFFHYFMDFVENLKRGPLTKFRINSQTSKLIYEHMKTTTTLEKAKRRRKKRQSKADVTY